jgi:hypothetical protein
MKYQTKFLSPPQREGARVLFPFRVSNGLSNQIVPIGIPIEFNGTAEALGTKRLTQGELIEFATAWLDFLVSNRKCDPFGRPNTDARIGVPLGVLDYWRDNRSIPDWLSRGSAGI